MGRFETGFVDKTHLLTVAWAKLARHGAEKQQGNNWRLTGKEQGNNSHLSGKEQAGEFGFNSTGGLQPKSSAGGFVGDGFDDGLAARVVEVGVGLCVDPSGSGTGMAVGFRRHGSDRRQVRALAPDAYAARAPPCGERVAAQFRRLACGFPVEKRRPGFDMRSLAQTSEPDAETLERWRSPVTISAAALKPVER